MSADMRLMSVKDMVQHIAAGLELLRWQQMLNLITINEVRKQLWDLVDTLYRHKVERIKLKNRGYINEL